jgi:hypothetical protein
VRYCFILSLDHSRSTVIDMYLAKALSGISMGEVRRTLWPSVGERSNRIRCSCGEAWGRCEFWLQFDKDFVAAARHYVNGEGVMLVDSSKELGHFRGKADLLSDHEIKCVAVIVIRQYDQWRQSAIAANKRHNRGFRDLLSRGAEHRLSSLRLLLRNAPCIPYLEWLFTNFRLIWAARHGDSFVITSSKDANDLIEQLNSEVKRATPHGTHIVRGNRVANAPMVDLDDFCMSWVAGVFKKFWRVSSCDKKEHSTR